MQLITQVLRVVPTTITVLQGGKGAAGGRRMALLTHEPPSNENAVRRSVRPLLRLAIDSRETLLTLLQFD